MIKSNDVLLFFDFKKSQFIPYTQAISWPNPSSAAIRGDQIKPGTKAFQ
jgi:hypothetical protein